MLKLRWGPFRTGQKKETPSPTLPARGREIDPVSSPAASAPESIEEVTRETVDEALLIKRNLGATIDPWERLDRQGI